MTTVAVVGLGRMGSAMARALAASDADFDLVLHNRSADRAKVLADELGARSVDSPAEAAATADVAITMLADQGAVETVWDGDDGLVAGAHEGGVLIDMSTVPPETLPPFADRAREGGADLLDAPVSGSTALAQAGKLTIMAGGNPSALDRARPVLDALSQRVFHMGELGSGHAMKLAVNAVIFALNNAVSEALVLAERAGVDRELAYEVLATSAVGAPYLDYKRAAFLDPVATSVAFSLDLAEKDLRLITAFSKRLGVPLAQAATNRALIGEAAGAIGPDRDFSAVADYLRGRAGEGGTD